GAFMVWVGGDWMLAGRFIVHIMPVALVLATDTLSRLAARRGLPALASLIIVVQLCGLVRAAAVGGGGTAASVSRVDPTVASRLTWFERSNRLFMRDAQVIPAVERVVARLAFADHPKPNIFSGQMGFVMYNLASARFGLIDVTDRHGLADNRFAGC